MAKPNIGIMTKIGEAHVGNLRNSIDNVVRAKQELIDGLAQKGLLILNLDDPYTKQFNLSNFKGRVLYYSRKFMTAHYRASNIVITPYGQRFKVHFGNETFVCSIPVFGIHNISNALGAIAAAHNLGMSKQQIINGLAKFCQPKWRLQIVKGINNSTIINDSYNANPTSMCAGLDVLQTLSRNKKSIAVLGDMLELGATSLSGHSRVGRHLVKLKINNLLTIGNQAKVIANSAANHGMPKRNIFTCNTRQEAFKLLKSKLTPGTVAFFKASRNAALEKLVQQLIVTQKNPSIKLPVKKL